MKHQEQFAHELSDIWLAGNKEYVRITIRNLKNKAQAAYIAAAVAALLVSLEESPFDAVTHFVAFMHPNNN